MIQRCLGYFAKRFVAGETMQDGLRAVRQVNAQGMKAILDYLGEDVTTPAEASAAAEEYVELIKLIQAARVDSEVSMKLSQMGLLISKDLCFDNLARVMVAAAKANTRVWIDMEGSALTQRTIDAFDTLRSAYPSSGLCLQAYLVRTGGDLDRLMKRPLNVRLCKGAYKEPPTIAYASKRAVDGNYRMLVQKLLERVSDGVYPAFATHDRFLIDYILAIVREKGVDPKNFEFEMLYGIQNRLLQDLARQGYRTRVYIPYGKSWLPYFVRRLRERKENLFFVLKNLLRS
jgi:proline dehydrogenase